MRIGSVEPEGPPETSFAGIAGAVLLPSGEMVVADGGNRVVSWFDGSGTHIRSVGREGEGPAEFRDIYWIGACPGGQLLVIDPIAGRATYMAAADGEVVRTVVLAPTLGFNPPLSCEGGEQLPVPERQPAFLAMRADAAGRVWLRLPGSGESGMWRIFDDAGRLVASIEVPSDVEPMDIGERSMIALERGPLDVPLIRVYALPHPLQPDAGS